MDDTTPHNASCPNCRADFTCGVAAGKDHCWCFELPRIRHIDAEVGGMCLCPECLAEQIEVTKNATPDAKSNAR